MCDYLTFFLKKIPFIPVLKKVPRLLLLMRAPFTPTEVLIPDLEKLNLNGPNENDFLNDQLISF